MIASLSVLCAFMAVVSASAPTAAFGKEMDMDFLEQLRAEGRNGWIAMEEEFKETRFAYEIVEIDTAPKESSRRVKRIEGQLAGGQFLIRETLLPGSDIEVNCRNQEYEFNLFGSPKNWVLRWQGKGRNPKGPVESDYEYLVGILRLPWSIAAVPLAKLVADDRFQVTGVDRMSAEEVAFDFVVKREEGDANDLQGLSGGHLVLDPTRKWAIRRYSVQYKSGMKEVVELTYRPSGPPWISRLVLVMEVPPDRRSEFRLDGCRYDPGPVNTEQFKLGAFGLPEYHEPIRARRRVVFACLGMILVLLGLLLGRRMRRRDPKDELEH
ncbi:MAG: hypothetical protein ACLP9L_17970 [Thermoguttaceae bacterium]